MRDKTLGGVRRTLAEHHPYRTLLTKYSRQFLMLVPIADGATQRRVLKFGYDEPFIRQGGAWTLLAGEPLKARFEVPAAEEAESFHFEVAVPEGLQISRGILSAVGNMDDAPDPDERIGGFPRMHLHVRDFPPRARANAAVSVGAVRGGWLTIASLSVCLIAAILSVGTFWIATIKPGLKVDIANTTAALLLALPGLFATLLVRPGEHAMVAYVFRAVRWILVTSSLLVYSAVALLVMQRPISEITKMWRVLACAALVLALATLFYYWTPMISRLRAKFVLFLAGIMGLVAADLLLIRGGVPAAGSTRLVGGILVLASFVLFVVAYVMEMRYRNTKSAHPTTR
jgi:hypothetical protein